MDNLDKSLISMLFIGAVIGCALATVYLAAFVDRGRYD